MPANSRVFLKPFIGGLNTEASDVDDMVLNTSDELNCTILPEQMRGRRYGFNIEKDGKWIDSGEEIIAHSLYHWNNVYDNVNYLVVQINDKLYIYPDERPFSQQNYLTVIDLSEYRTLTITEPVSMTSVTNSLFVVGKWIKPLVIEAIANTNMFTTIVNNPKFRDFNGVEDGYAVDYLPTASEGLTARHKYNLINQGWDKTIYDPTSNPKSRPLLPDGQGYEGLFFEEYADEYGVGCYPANNMQWFLGKQNSGKYNTTDLLNTFFGNTPAPKGHFIIDYLNRDRSAVSGIDLDSVPAELDKNYDTTIPVNNSEGWAAWGLFMRRLNNYQDEAYITIPQNYKITYALPINLSGTLTKYSWGLKDDCSVVEVTDSSQRRYIYNNIIDMNRTDSRLINDYIFSQPFTVSLIGVTGNGTEITIATEIINPTGKMFSARGWDFTVVNTTSYTRYEIQISWPNLDRSHKWIVPDTLTETVVIHEINYDSEEQESYEGLPSSDLLRGAITDVESFGGRVFYLCGNTLLFSQTLSTNNKNFDKCYQEADPTSEEVSDVVATDGGMIQLLSLGRGKALKSFYRGILIFGDEEVTGVLSNSINLFSAESYDVVKISTAGLTSKYSVVETDNAVFYWSNHGIYVVSIDENNNISANCISLATIQNWYNNLSQTAKDNCVGYYDYANNRIYWFYPTTNMTDKLDGCLVYDLTFNCFMPQYVDSGSVIRDMYGNFSGILSNYKNSYKRDGKIYSCSVIGDNVFDDNNYLIGKVQNKYLTDCQESSSVYEIEPTVYLRAGGNRVIAGDYKVLANSTKDAGFNRKTAGVFLISDGTQYSFGDFNDREFRDWDTSPYESYLVSRPITLGDTYFNKQTPVMQTLFKRTEEYKLNKVDINPNEVIYNLESLPDKTIPTGRRSTTFLIDAGIFKKAKISVDLSRYTSTDIIHNISCAVYGHTEYNDTGTTIAFDSLYPDVHGGSKYVFELNSDDLTNSYKMFTITVSESGQLGTDLDKEIPCTMFVYLEKEDITAPIFKGFKEITLSGSSKMTKTYSTRYEHHVNSEYGFLKEATISFSPVIDQFFDVPYNWSGTGTCVVARGISAGITGTVTKASPSLTGTANTVSSTYFTNTFGAFLDELSVTGAQLHNDTVNINYSYKILVPEYEVYTKYSIQDYTTPSGAYIRMRWGWSVNPLSNRWDMVQNGYRPQKDFLHDDYVESRLHIHGRGKAFQIEIRNDDNKDFRLTGLNIITRSPQ